jgi:hypothetical protein
MPRADRFKRPETVSALVWVFQWDGYDAHVVMFLVPVPPGPRCRHSYRLTSHLLGLGGLRLAARCSNTLGDPSVDFAFDVASGVNAELNRTGEGAAHLQLLDVALVEAGLCVDGRRSKDSERLIGWLIHFVLLGPLGTWRTKVGAKASNAEAHPTAAKFQPRFTFSVFGPCESCLRPWGRVQRCLRRSVIDRMIAVEHLRRQPRHGCSHQSCDAPGRRSSTPARARSPAF